MNTLFFTITLNIIIILISFYLLFLYIKSTTFHKYPCYNIIILSFIIFIDNILRLIPLEIFKYIQAFILTFLDKLLLTTITSQAYIIYLGVVKTKFYYKYEKIIFFSTLFITIFIDLLIMVIFFSISQEITNYKNNDYEGNNYYYYKGDPSAKLIIDTIFNTIFLCLNTYSIVFSLIYIFKKKKEASLGLIEDLDYGHHYLRILLMFIVNSVTFIESYLIIYSKIPIENIDFIYLTTCLIIDLYYTINKIIIKETLNIFCKEYYNKKYNKDRDRDRNESVLTIGDEEEGEARTSENYE